MKCKYLYKNYVLNLECFKFGYVTMFDDEPEFCKNCKSYDSSLRTANESRAIEVRNLVSAIFNKKER